MARHSIAFAASALLSSLMVAAAGSPTETSASPSPSPTSFPTSSPILPPDEVTSEPSVAPIFTTMRPSGAPVSATKEPTALQTMLPTCAPSYTPVAASTPTTAQPTLTLTTAPTLTPSMMPSALYFAPTTACPSVTSTLDPTQQPTPEPTPEPTPAVEEWRPIRLYGVNFTPRGGPDWDPRCKNYTTILRELKVLKVITNRVRTFSLNDCDADGIMLKAVQEMDMMLWMGVWIAPEDNTDEEDPEFFTNEKKTLIKLLEYHKKGKRNFSRVIGMHVGSEAIFRGEITAGRNIRYRNEIKNILVNAGFEFPVTISEIPASYHLNPSVFNASDTAISANSFPYWEFGNVLTSGSHIKNSINYLLTLAAKYGAGGKEFILTETGWPTAGTTKTSPANPSNATRYLQEFYCEVALKEHWKYFYFIGIDPTWRIAQMEREKGEIDSVEGHFGIFYDDLVLKPEFRDLRFKCDATGPTVEYLIFLPTESPTRSPVTNSPLEADKTHAPTLTPTVCPTTVGPTISPTTHSPSGSPTQTPSTGSPVEYGPSAADAASKGSVETSYYGEEQEATVAVLVIVGVSVVAAILGFAYFGMVRRRGTDGSAQNTRPPSGEYSIEGGGSVGLPVPPHITEFKV